MALEGRCQEALPLLKQARGEVRDPELKKQVGKGGVRCSMILHDEGTATQFLTWLRHDFPNDPEILLLAVHAYSDLAVRSSDALTQIAPGSAEVIQLNAENFEKQGDFKSAIAQYRTLLQRRPNTPAIHYRIGALLFSHSTSSSSAAEARREFEAELKIYPQSGGSEYYLGELARQQDKLPEAIEHYTRATQFSPELGEAYYGLGRCLLDSGRAWDSLTSLKTAVRLLPDNPNAHFALATAYQKLGKKEDAAREFALQKTTAEKLNQNTTTLKKTLAGPAEK